METRGGPDTLDECAAGRSGGGSAARPSPLGGSTPLARRGVEGIAERLEEGAEASRWEGGRTVTPPLGVRSLGRSLSPLRSGAKEVSSDHTPRPAPCHPPDPPAFKSPRRPESWHRSNRRRPPIFRPPRFSPATCRLPGRLRHHVNRHRRRRARQSTDNINRLRVLLIYFVIVSWKILLRRKPSSG